MTFFPQFILGVLGMPRRYHVYPPEFQVWHVMSSAGASIPCGRLRAATVLPGLVAVLRAARAKLNYLEFVTPAH
jgi:heme/copper-type cytochrome/quinol oxidase subunit 1